MKELKTRKEAIDFIGNKTMLEFKLFSDGVLFYDTCEPFDFDGNLKHITIEVFHNDLSPEFWRLMTMEDLVYRRQIFEINIRGLENSNGENVYHDKFKDPKLN